MSATEAAAASHSHCSCVVQMLCGLMCYSQVHSDDRNVHENAPCSASHSLRLAPQCHAFF